MSNPEINKSTNHSKITGNFGEFLLLYWLSKHGFECAHVDHVGLDLIARNPHSDELMGISVKSRSRDFASAGSYVSILNSELPKLKSACKTFRCKPYFAVVVDEPGSIWAFILSLPHLTKICPPRKEAISWRMSDECLKQYEEDRQIRTFRFKTETGNWWSKVPK